MLCFTSGSRIVRLVGLETLLRLGFAHGLPPIRYPLILVRFLLGFTKSNVTRAIYRAIEILRHKCCCILERNRSQFCFFMLIFVFRTSNSLVRKLFSFITEVLISSFFAVQFYTHPIMLHCHKFRSRRKIFTHVISI